jgi:hypothetical protein
MATNLPHVSLQFAAGSVAHIVIQCPGSPDGSLGAPMTVSDWMAIFNQARQVDVGSRPEVALGHPRGDIAPTTPNVRLQLSTATTGT